MKKENLHKLNIQLFANNDLSSVFATINKTLKDVKTKDITSESSEQFASLPDGYYFTEVLSSEVTVSANSGNPMVKWVLVNVEDGVFLNEHDEFDYIKNSVKKRHYVYSSLKNAQAIERFISDALKFEGETPGEPYLEKEYFETAETMADALELLQGRRIWLHVDTTENMDGSSSTWTRFVSFKRAVALGLEKE